MGYTLTSHGDERTDNKIESSPSSVDVWRAMVRDGLAEEFEPGNYRAV